MSHDLSLASSPIASALPELRARIEESGSSIRFLTEAESIIDGSIRFRRRVRAEWDSTLKRYQPLKEERLEWELTTVIVTSAEALVDYVAQGGNALVDWLSDVRLTLNFPLKEQLVLLVRGMSKYHSQTKSVASRTFREAARAGLVGEEATAMPNQPIAGRLDKDQIEAELIRAQVVQRIFVIHGGS